MCVVVFFFKQKTAYEMRISDWSADVCSSDLSTWARNDLGRLSALSLVRPLVPATDGSFSIAFSRLTGRGVVVPSTRGCVASRRPSCRLSHASVACAHFDSSSHHARGGSGRLEARRVGKGCVSTCSTGGVPYN